MMFLNNRTIACSKRWSLENPFIKEIQTMIIQGKRYWNNFCIVRQTLINRDWMDEKSTKAGVLHAVDADWIWKALLKTMAVKSVSPDVYGKSINWPIYAPAAIWDKTGMVCCGAGLKPGTILVKNNKGLKQQKPVPIWGVTIQPTANDLPAPDG